MADTLEKQAKQYSDARPRYPSDLFQFIASKTPSHQLAWDVGTGSSQAAKYLAEMYEKVIGTDASEKKLEYAVKLPNVRYEHTQSTMSMSELEIKVAPEGTVDVLTITQPVYYYGPTLYAQVKGLLKKPHGVIAASCHTVPRVTDSVDEWIRAYYYTALDPQWWDHKRLIMDNPPPGEDYFLNPFMEVDDDYWGEDFPFEEVDGLEGTGPIEFVSVEEMDFEGYLTYLRSWSAYQAAKDKGVELLGDDDVERLKTVWAEDGCEVKAVKFPVYLSQNWKGGRLVKDIILPDDKSLDLYDFYMLNLKQLI